VKRLFVAVDLPPAVRQQVASLCFGLPGVRWVPEEQIHLTLRFIGEVNGNIFHDIREGLAEIRFPAFDMRLQGVGYFPPRRAPKVIWVGVEKNEALARLRNRVESTLVRIGLEPEGRKFAPHITLGRLKETPLPKVAAYLAGYDAFGTDAFPVEEFRLYSSTLTSDGATHTVEAEYPLQGPLTGDQ